MSISDSKDKGIITLALVAFIARCNSEAERMDALFQQYGESKCTANAAASRRMKDDAQAALDRL